MLYGLSWGCGPAAQRSGLFPLSILPTNQAFPPACKCPNPPSLFSMMTSLSSVRMGAIFPASSQPFAGCVSVFSPFPSGREVLLSRASMIPFSLPGASGEWTLTQNLFA